MWLWNPFDAPTLHFTDTFILYNTRYTCRSWLKSSFSLCRRVKWVYSKKAAQTEAPLAACPETGIQAGGLVEELMLSGRPSLTSNPLRQKTQHSRCFSLVPNKLVTSCPLPARLVWIGPRAGFVYRCWAHYKTGWNATVDLEQQTRRRRRWLLQNCAAGCDCKYYQSLIWHGLTWWTEGYKVGAEYKRIQ